MVAASVVLQARSLGFGYPKQPALFANWSLDIFPGVTWVGGDESSGKTTLLRLLAGELSPNSGSLQVNGILFKEQAQAYRDQIAWVDPRTQALDALTPQAYWDGLRQQHPAFAEDLLADLIDGLALEPHLPKSLYMLSTGTRRKVFLAGAFASGAAVTLLDEPFAALDRASIGLVLELLQEAASHPSRVWVVADYVAPPEVSLAATVRYSDPCG
ncbi:MAG: ATP-binding cassette domain-containing protein [Burkholderiales bacterium]|nr:ATP-binding cassette domain-containing protein [Burkholderiales bacterium]